MPYEIQILEGSKIPAPLREIADPPKKLFLQGVLPDTEQSIFLCVVGSRKYTPYGKHACESLIAGLRRYPIVIVSGLALGMDSIAHEAALDAGLTTIAIPGSGLGADVLYPTSHRNLARRILRSGGALLSEFPIDFHATPYSFPQRNRIMAGISRAVLVIEAIKRSGTLITSRLATEYNRDVFAVPGSIFSENSSGPHMLIRLGATPITGSEDILEALGLEVRNKNTAAQQADSPQEQKILDELGAPKTRDALLSVLSLPPQELSAILSVMEIKGLIREYMGSIERV